MIKEVLVKLSIAIIGSRTFSDYKLMYSTVDKVIEEYIQEHGPIMQSDVQIISGGAIGADKLGAQYAYERGYLLTEYLAKWDDLSHPDVKLRVNHWGKQYDAGAGHRRNTEIIQNADIVVAFHNGSPGTADSLRKAKALKKKIIEIRFR
jgi:hypothetical protein